MKMSQVSNLLFQLNNERMKKEQFMRERDELSSQLKELQLAFSLINDDYSALIAIMDRARKLAFLVEEEEEDGPRFKMDANGNLTRIEQEE
jgi:prespore-specific regulator